MATTIDYAVTQVSDLRNFFLRMGLVVVLTVESSIQWKFLDTLFLCYSRINLVNKFQTATKKKT